MLDLVLDGAAEMAEAIRHAPRQAARAQANGGADRAWELTTG